MKKAILILAVIAAASTGKVFAQDFTGTNDMGGGMGSMMSAYSDAYRTSAEERLATAVVELDLTESQTKQMKKILMSEEQGLANIKSAFGLSTDSSSRGQMNGGMPSGGEMMAMSGDMGMMAGMFSSSSNYDYKEVSRMLEKHSVQHDKKYKKVLSQEQYDKWVKTENKIYSALLAAL